MPRPGSGRQRQSNRRRPSIFLNLPYDASFQNLFLAYIAGVSALGMTPRATLEIPSSARRLDRIFKLISSCPYSVHDLSRVQLDRSRPVTPRFNMPFELGMAVARQKAGGDHAWFVFERMNHRIKKSLSDLDGTDAYIHRGRIDRVFSQPGNAFSRRQPRPTVAQMRAIYRALRTSVDEILRETGADTLFEARPFHELSALAAGLTNQLLSTRNL
jgi:hypothetical protein